MNNMLYKHLDYSHFGVIPRYEPLQTKESTKMQGKKIVFVMGDGGGGGMAMPVLPLLLTAGCTVSVYLVGTCAKQYEAGTRFFGERIAVKIGQADPESINDYFQHTDTDLVVVCASNDPECVRAAKNAAQLSGAEWTLGLEDMYASLHETLSNGGINYFTRVLVSDEFSRDLMLQKFPENDQLVVVAGNPKFDTVPKRIAEWGDTRNYLRSEIEVSDSDTVIGIAGGVTGTAEMLQLAYEAILLGGLRSEAKIILRTHPRATVEDKKQTSALIGRLPTSLFRNLDRTIVPTSDEILECCDVFCSPFSTSGSLGVLLQMPRIVFVGSPQCAAYFTSEKGLPLPPEVEVGAAWYVQDACQLSNILRLDPPEYPQMNAMIQAQTKLAQYTDGHSADRIFTEIHKLFEA